MKAPKKIYLAFLFLIVGSISEAQDGNWDVYLAQYEKGVGSTLLDLSLKDAAPKTDFPFVLITGVSFKDCKDDGLPSGKEFDNLYRVSDSVKTKIENFVKVIPAGTFTYQCERLDYYYINDSSGIRKTLEQLYSSRFRQYTSYINIKEDRKWEAYLEFLYPNEETFEFMQNEKVVSKLAEAGDKLEKERKIDHWIYFDTDRDRNCFIEYALKKNFKVESKQKDVNLLHPFKLQMSRTDKADVASISEVTIELRKQAKQCNGDYDGWETFVIK